MENSLWVEKYRPNTLENYVDNISGISNLAESTVKAAALQMDTDTNKVLENLNKTEHEIIYKDWKIGDIKFFDVSNTKLKDIGFKWNMDFDKGLEETLLWSQKWFTGNV